MSSEDYKCSLVTCPGCHRKTMSRRSEEDYKSPSVGDTHRLIDGGKRSEEDDFMDQYFQRNFTVKPSEVRYTDRILHETLLTVEPSEVRFTAELGKQLTCPLQLFNDTDQCYIAFKVTATDPKKYRVRPNDGVVLARSTCDIIVTMQAQREFPEDMQCMDEFLVQSVFTTSRYVELYMFNEDSGCYIHERKLRVVYVSPLQSPSLIVEGSEEGSSPSTPVSDDENSNTSYLGPSSEKYTSSLCGAMRNQHLSTIDGGNSSNLILQKEFAVEPSEVRFTVELGKQLTCPLRLWNTSFYFIAFKVTATDPKKYSVLPNKGVVSLWSTCDIMVTMQAQREFPEDMQCGDKFLIQFTDTDSGDINFDKFEEDSRCRVHERKLRVVYVSPLQSPSPIVEGSKEGSSPSTPVSDDGNSNTSDLTSIPKEDEEPEKQYSEIPKEDEEPVKQYSKKHMLLLTMILGDQGDLDLSISHLKKP